MNILKTVLVIPMAALLAMPVYANHGNYDGHAHFDKRMERQKSRVRQGVQSGELTRKEASELRHQQKKIAKQARKFSRDGHLDRNERQKLERKLDKASHRIYRLKHNDRNRHAQHGRHGKHKLVHGNHHGKHKPAYGYRYGKHAHRSKHAYHGHGGRYYANDGWALVLRLSDDF